MHDHLCLIILADPLQVSHLLDLDVMCLQSSIMVLHILSSEVSAKFCINDTHSMGKRYSFKGLITLKPFVGLVNQQWDQKVIEFNIPPFYLGFYFFFVDLELELELIASCTQLPLSIVFGILMNNKTMQH